MFDSDIGFKEKSSYYEKSGNFKDEKTIKVFLENFNDSRIWTDAFPKPDDVSLHFTTLSVLENRDLVDSPAEGCQKLQELSEQYELGSNLIICMDSDYSYIRSVINSTLDTYDRDYIFETYSHSIENTKYFDAFIVDSISRYISEDKSSDKFEIIFQYYRDISKSIYSPFVKTLALRNFENKSISNEDNIMIILSEFKDISFNKQNTCTNFKNNPKWQSVKSKLSNLDNSLNTELSNRSIDINTIFEKLRENNITEDNIYLFVRGHDLAAMLNKHLISFYEHLFNAKCSEICDGHTDAKLKRDCKANMFNNKPVFSLVEKKDLSKHPFMSKTIERIKSMLEEISASEQLSA